MNYEFKFDLGSKVKITELKVSGRITELCVTIWNLDMYKVRYFYPGELKETYFYPDEIEFCKCSSKDVQ